MIQGGLRLRQFKNALDWHQTKPESGGKAGYRYVLDGKSVDGKSDEHAEQQANYGDLVKIHSASNAESGFLYIKRDGEPNRSERTRTGRSWGVDEGSACTSMMASLIHGTRIPSPPRTFESRLSNDLFYGTGRSGLGAANMINAVAGARLIKDTCTRSERIFHAGAAERWMMVRS